MTSPKTNETSLKNPKISENSPSSESGTPLSRHASRTGRGEVPDSDDGQISKIFYDGDFQLGNLD